MIELTPEQQAQLGAIDAQAELTLARVQQIFATDGMALNQCGHCGTFRLDGRRPILHLSGCPDDGWWWR